MDGPYISLFLRVGQPTITHVYCIAWWIRWSFSFQFTKTFCLYKVSPKLGKHGGKKRTSLGIKTQTLTVIDLIIVRQRYEIKSHFMILSSSSFDICFDASCFSWQMLEMVKVRNEIIHCINRHLHSHTLVKDHLGQETTLLLGPLFHTVFPFGFPYII